MFVFYNVFWNFKSELKLAIQHLDPQFSCLYIFWYYQFNYISLLRKNIPIYSKAICILRMHAVDSFILEMDSFELKVRHLLRVWLNGSDKVCEWIVDLRTKEIRYWCLSLYCSLLCLFLFPSSLLSMPLTNSFRLI